MGWACSMHESYERCIESECRRSFERPWHKWEVNVTASVRKKWNVWILLAEGMVHCGPLACFELGNELLSLGTERISIASITVCNAFQF
jgi:hypothetical protein